MIIASTIIIVAVVGVSFYGANVGDFVVGVEEEVTAYLTLSESGDFLNDSVDGLRAEGLSGATDSTYGYIPKDIEQGFGIKNDTIGQRYMAYSFCLKNISAITVNYAMRIDLLDSTNNVDEAVRVMVIEESMGVKTKTIYAKPKADGTAEDHSNPTRDDVEPYLTTKFYSPSVVCREVVDTFVPDQETKYTVVMWLEGEDEQCVDAIKGGVIKFEMVFSVK